MTIPHVDVKAQYAPLIPQLQEAFARTLETGRFIFGPEVEAFEREAAALLGVQDTVSCANGTDALVLVLDALEIGAGDEVICPAFTFYPTKNLFALGDGGLIAVNDSDVAQRLRMLRFHGSESKKEFLYVGYNSRLDAMQASFLRIFLEHITHWNEQRREAAARYTELLDGLVQTPIDEPGHVYHMYCVRSPERDGLAAARQDAGIGVAICLP